MGRKTTNGYITPLKSDGTPATFAPGADATLTGRGVFTLSAGTTYYFPFGGADGRVNSTQLEFDNAIVISDAHVEDSNVLDQESNAYDASNAWVPEEPTTAYLATKNGNVTSTTNGVLITGGGTGGSAIWTIADMGTRRGRLVVTVGGTGGEVRNSVCGRE